MPLAFDEIVMLEALLIFRVTRLGEIVHVELAHDRGKVVVLEVSGEDLLSELVRPVHHEAGACRIPKDSRLVSRVLEKIR